MIFNCKEKLEKNFLYTLNKNLMSDFYESRQSEIDLLENELELLEAKVDENHSNNCK